MTEEADRMRSSRRNGWMCAIIRETRPVNGCCEARHTGTERLTGQPMYG